MLLRSTAKKDSEQSDQSAVEGPHPVIAKAVTNKRKSAVKYFFRPRTQQASKKSENKNKKKTKQTVKTTYKLKK